MNWGLEGNLAHSRLTATSISNRCRSSRSCFTGYTFNNPWMWFVRFSFQMEGTA
jgi:hypothetical protein